MEELLLAALLMQLLELEKPCIWLVVMLKVCRSIYHQHIMLYAYQSWFAWVLVGRASSLLQTVAMSCCQANPGMLYI